MNFVLVISITPRPPNTPKKKKLKISEYYDNSQLWERLPHTHTKKNPVFNFSFIHYNDKVLFHAIVRGFTISMLQISKKLVKNSICEDNTKQINIKCWNKFISPNT